MLESSAWQTLFIVSIMYIHHVCITVGQIYATDEHGIAHSDGIISVSMVISRRTIHQWEQTETVVDRYDILQLDGIVYLCIESKVIVPPGGEASHKCTWTDAITGKLVNTDKTYTETYLNFHQKGNYIYITNMHL